MAENILPRVLKAYRQDVKTGKLETLPIKLNRAQLIEIASGLNTAKEFGMPAIGKEKLANKVLLEGRADAGTNEYNYKNRHAKDLYEILLASQVPELSARYAAAVLDKSQAAERLNIPFERAWNGTGIAAETKRTGQQHADRSKQFGKPELDPKNLELVDTIQRAADGNLTPQERILTMSNSDKLLQALLNINSPATRRESDGIFYTKEAKDAASLKLEDARKRATTEEKKASKLLFGVDVLRGLPDAYMESAGVEPKKYVFGPAPEASDPMMKYIVGNVEPKPVPPPEQGILDKILALFK